MQQQYNQIKQQHPDDIVLFRLGDFYEAFSTDAETLSKTIGITLTGRGKDENRIPMAGIPYHALDNYLPKMVKAGLRVVIVDQLSEPKPGELVERGVSKIYTAGTLTEENTLVDETNNYLLSIYAAQDNKKNTTYGVAFCDVSTGKLEVFETANVDTLQGELARIAPAETIIAKEQLENIKPLAPTNVTLRDPREFDPTSALQLIVAHFGVKTLKGFGIAEDSAAIPALGALLSYLRECQRSALSHLTELKLYPLDDYMRLDEYTIRNLELVQPASGDDYSATVYHQLNQCHTSMGKRKLYDWLLRPLLTAESLQERLDSVDFYYQDSIFTDKLRDLLREVADIERIVGRIGVGSAGARELIALRDSLETISRVHELFADEQLSNYITNKLSNLQAPALTSIRELISTSINSEAPASITEGQIIATGYHAEVDELRELSSGGKSNLAQIQAREIASTGISSLKVSYNKVFGYYIEVTKTHVDKVPETYIRKQTLANAERYITPELKEWEDKVLSAEEKLVKLEYELFVGIRSEIAHYTQELLRTAGAIAEIDVLANFGYIAKQYNYVKPTLTSENSLLIDQGRHLVVERLQHEFTPNSIDFNSETKLVILTGPNMSGKSTFIRQVALITLLAQVGCFVPAERMEFGLVDRIFTRVGASDNLSRGESTFMVEMYETANILNNATERSLIILDEVGRGTSTYDGVAIAWSIVEYIHTHLQAKTLFATHYHELVALEDELAGVKNYHVEVKESGQDIIFQHSISPGSTSRSYGVHVAKMAGVPSEVVQRAGEILDNFEGKSKPKTKNGKFRLQDPGSPQARQASPGVKSSPQRPKKIAPEQLGLI